MHPDRQPLFFFSHLRPNVGRLRWPGTTRTQPWSMVSIFIWDDLTSYWYRNFKNRFVPSQPHTSYFKRCFKYNRARVWNCKSHDLCSAVTLRPRCTGQILVHFFPYHILPSLTNLQRCYIIPPWGRTNLCLVWNLTDFSNYDLKENINQENSISLSKCKSLMKKAAKIFAFYIVVKRK